MQTLNLFPAAAIRGRLLGATILACFSALWLFSGLSESGCTPPLAMIVAALFLAVALVARRLVSRQLLPASAGMAARLDGVGPTSRVPSWRAFILINVAQWVAIFVAVQVLQLLGREAWITLAVIAVVGLHFFPLGRLFGFRLHYVTGTALLGVVLLCIALAPANPQTPLAPLGTGVILWISAMVTVRSAWRVTRRAKIVN